MTTTDLQEQLTKLVDTLHMTQPHFVRCIIPNHEKKVSFIASLHGPSLIPLLPLPLSHRQGR